jgi:sugar (pentulose or hexulose) kinase
MKTTLEIHNKFQSLLMNDPLVRSAYETASRGLDDPTDVWKLVIITLAETLAEAKADLERLLISTSAWGDDS